MDYGQAWSVLFGDRDVHRVVTEFQLTAAELDEWLGTAEQETAVAAFKVDPEAREQLLEELAPHHARVLAELQASIQEG